MLEISSTLTSGNSARLDKKLLRHILSAFYFFPGYTGQTIGKAMREEQSTKPATSSKS
jgi:hypothetical protein